MIVVNKKEEKDKFKYNNKKFVSNLAFDVNRNDVEVIQKVALKEPRYNLNDTQPILLESLIWDKICGHVDSETKRGEIFKQVCQCLVNNKIIRPTFKLESLQPLRERFSLYLNELIKVISQKIDQNSNCSDINSISLFTKVYQTQEKDTKHFIVKLNSKYHKLLSSSRNILALESPRCLNDFIDEGLIDKGGFGFVHKMRHKLDGCCYAMKIIPFKYKNATIFNKIIREAEIFAKLSYHQYVVNYKTSWIENYLEVDSKIDSDPSFTFNHKRHKLAIHNQSRLKESFCKVTELNDVDLLNSQFLNSESKSQVESESQSEPESKSESESDSNSESDSEPYSESVSDSVNDKSTNDLEPHQVGQTETQDLIFDISISSNSMNVSNSIQSAKSIMSCNSSESPKIKAFLFIQMELCDKNLRTWLDERNKAIFEAKLSQPDADVVELVDKQEILQIFTQIVEGVEFLHQQNLIHRDLKPQNILFARNDVKISDFGLTTINETVADEVARTSSNKFEKRTIGLGTGIYASPEQKTTSNYDHKSDIYTLGLILCELVYPFATDMERYKCFEDLSKHHRLAFNLKDDFFSQLILDLTQSNPGLRPDSSELLLKLNVQKENIKFRVKNDLDQMTLENEKLRQIVTTLEQENMSLKNKIISLMSSF